MTRQAAGCLGRQCEADFLPAEPPHDRLFEQPPHGRLFEQRGISPHCCRPPMPNRYQSRHFSTNESAPVQHRGYLGGRKGLLRVEQRRTVDQAFRQCEADFLPSLVAGWRLFDSPNDSSRFSSIRACLYCPQTATRTRLCCHGSYKRNEGAYRVMLCMEFFTKLVWKISHSLLKAA